MGLILVRSISHINSEFEGSAELLSFSIDWAECFEPKWNLQMPVSQIEVQFFHGKKLQTSKRQE
jgi:hypothetical protein